MRLVYAVLLPGVIVFVSSGNVLYARAAEGDETNVVARRFLQHVPSAATVKEAGCLTNLVDFVKKFYKKPARFYVTSPEVTGVLASVRITKENNGENYADLAAQAQEAFRNHLKAVLEKWKERDHKKKTDSFMGSSDFRDFCTRVDEANQLFPKEYAINLYALLESSLTKKQLQKIVLKGFANNDPKGQEFHGLFYGKRNPSLV
uniref:Uncharacterized protein n=1 Tax=Peronospora matthiolae TaxID=2874970 RepID=A0AAV1VEC7_9STRA